MDKWQEFLKSHRSRLDHDEPFYPEKLDNYKPALLNTMSVLNCAYVATKVLSVIAMRGGTRLKPSAFKTLTAILNTTLPTEVVHHCDEEAMRILKWLETPATDQDHVVELPQASPDLDIMFGADIESRISVAEFALREGYDLELEYYMPDQDRWPRLRARPIELFTDEVGEGDGDEDDEQVLVVESQEGQRHEILVRTLRWLMPVSRTQQPRKAAPKTARVLTFPTGKED